MRLRAGTVGQGAMVAEGSNARRGGIGGDGAVRYELS